MIKGVLIEKIKIALGGLGLDCADGEISLEHPNDLQFGNYTTNLAMVIAKTVGDSPKDLAKKIVEKIQLDENLKDIQVAGPGFVNFYLSDRYLSENVRKILEQGDDYGRNNFLENRRIMVEYTDTNLFKEFHIGHLMSNVIGEFLSRVIEANGAQVKRVCYQSDVGLNIAKAIWGYQKSVKSKEENPSVSDWGRFYALGSQAYQEDKVAQKMITAINHQIYTRSDQEINEIYDRGRETSLEYFETIYARLDTKFDFYFFESETGSIGKKMVEEGLADGLFEESDGAVVFRGEKYDPRLHTRVFINSFGLPTYEAKELGLAELKDQKYPHDLSLSVTGNEVVAYFEVVLKALALMRSDLAAKIKHLPHGMLRLPMGKMSSRTGQVFTAEALIAEAKERVAQKIADRKLNPKEMETITEAVAIGAIKYSILKQSPERDIIFDFDKSLSFEGDSGPYLQYAYTRAQSVLARGEKDFLEFDKNDKITILESKLEAFPETVSKAYQELAPQRIVTYLISLAGSFNSYYAQNKIIGSENEPYRLALTKAVAQTFKSGLTLLGLPILEKM